MATTAVAAKAEQQFLVVKLERLRESKTNPRKHFDKKGMEELAASIKEKGVLVPILVRPKTVGFGRGDEDAGFFEVVAGARRFRAAKEAGIQEIPVIARELDDSQALEVQVIENLQRADVHPLEEAEGYKQLLDQSAAKKSNLRYDVATIAGKVGKSESYVYQRLKLVEMIPPAKKLFVEDKITAGHAILIARLQPAEQAHALAAIIRDEWTPDGKVKRAGSVRDLDRWIETNIHLDLKSAPFNPEDTNLVAAAGACVSCPKNTGTNRSLFADLRGGDRCTDPKCYTAKVDAFVQVKKKSAGPLLHISSEWGSSRGKGKEELIYADKWEEAKAGSCKSAREALVVEGYDRGKMFVVCADLKCSTHHATFSRSSSADSDRYKREQLARERKRRVELDRRRRIFGAMVKSADLPAPGEWSSILKWAAEQLDHDHAKPFCEALGWEPKKEYGSRDYRGHIARRLAAVKPHQVGHWLLLLTIAAKDLAFGSYLNSIPKAQLLEASAKSRGVNVAKITKDVQAEVAAKKKRTKVQTSAKNKTHRKAA